MDRYTYDIYSNNRSNDFREQADQSDRRYDEFYSDSSARSSVARRKENWDRTLRYSSEEGDNGRRHPGEKRKNDGRNHNDRKYSPSSKRRHSSTKESPRKEKKEEEIPEEEVVVPDTLMDSVEKLRVRKEVRRNAADEDVEKLIVFCFSGKGYSCKTCGLLMTKKSAFAAHLTSKSHVLNVIEARTANTYKETRGILDMDLSPDDWFEQNDTARSIIMKQSRAHMKIEREIKLKEEANFKRTPSNFYHFKMERRQSVAKKEEKVIMTSLVESTVEMNEFGEDRFFGCEFVRAVTSFRCRLCSVNIREANEVLPHIDSPQHRENYATYTRKNPSYETTQRKQNKDLRDVMGEHVDKDVALMESDSAKDSCFLSRLDSTLVRIPTVMNPELKKEQEKKEKEKKEKEKKEKEKNEKEKKEKEKKEKEKKEKEKKEKEKKEKEKEKKEKEKEQKEKKKKDKMKKETDKSKEKGGTGKIDDVQENGSVVKTNAGVQENKEEEKVTDLNETDKEVQPTVEENTLNNEEENKTDAELHEDENGVANEGPMDNETPKRDGSNDIISCETTETTEATQPNPENNTEEIACENVQPGASSSNTTSDSSSSGSEDTNKISGESAMSSTKENCTEKTDGNFMDGFEVVDEVKDDAVS